MDTITEFLSTDEQRHNGAKAIAETFYGRGGSLRRDRDNGDADLATTNLANHEMRHAGLASAIQAVQVEGKSVNPVPDNWNHDAIKLRNIILREFVDTYFAE